ncbi:hypothetical protein TSOC_009730 [Tetrabaena socialis]|uniref:Uncharacterized protein n=1 Tax=Tetrabaena socialis TaxID=47790 RepID=A0A2J7ZV57_9CHLO|nr:hypothetical protein TSOC_009730 [Tetrabaena socialis]|eukprot:PNH04140.1 hypothetical protein TSOC_009730 [Tetrabaena socialis]
MAGLTAVALHLIAVLNDLTPPWLAAVIDALPCWLARTGTSNVMACRADASWLLPQPCRLATLAAACAGPSHCGGYGAAGLAAAVSPVDVRWTLGEAGGGSKSGVLETLAEGPSRGACRTSLQAPTHPVAPAAMPAARAHRGSSSPDR